MDRNIIKELVKTKLWDICNVNEWYNQPFVTDTNVTDERLANGEVSDRELDVCRYDFVASVIHEIMEYVCENLNQPMYASNPYLSYIHDTVREEILEFIK